MMIIDAVTAACLFKAPISVFLSRLFVFFFHCSFSGWCFLFIIFLSGGAVRAVVSLSCEHAKSATLRDLQL
uniref:Uncharacterized protein n=1 Tax=Trypanosoma brucei TaxID=5691 RepID=Q583B9_9TRYP|nr:hypothetical protein, unlikely [Trypanosoma brucei]